MVEQSSPDSREYSQNGHRFKKICLKSIPVTRGIDLSYTALKNSCFYPTQTSRFHRVISEKRTETVPTVAWAAREMWVHCDARAGFIRFPETPRAVLIRLSPSPHPPTLPLSLSLHSRVWLACGASSAHHPEHTRALSRTHFVPPLLHALRCPVHPNSHKWLLNITAPQTKSDKLKYGRTWTMEPFSLYVRACRKCTRCNSKHSPL